jgi:hypothetical protein
MIGRRVIFTGQSGIKIGSVCEDYICKASRFVRGRQKPLFLKIEDVMKNIYLKEHKKADSPTLWIGEILMLPPPALYKLWAKAFKSVLNIIKAEENKNNDIFINFHACFYLHRAVEYLSLVKTKLVKRFQPDLFITLIDDIYDIHDRLRDSNQIFAYARATEPVDAILELMRILDWRAKEIMMTRHFANELDNIPHYVFAVKHSYDTLDKLIFENKPIFYISHPITEVRRLQKREEKEKANQMIEAIHRIENNSSYEFVSFLPTTIDELRIQKEKRDNKTYEYMPKLTPRWDLGKYQNPINLLYIPPPKGENNDPLWEKESKYSRELNLLLKALSDHIEVQVSSRDYKLVEQSDFIFVYRPCYNGNASDGVLKEIQYYMILTGSRSDKNCFVYMPTEDQNKLRIRQLEATLEDKIEEGTIAYCNGKKSITLNQEEENMLIAAGDNIDNLREVFTEIIHNKSLTCVAVREGLGYDKAQQAIVFITQTVKGYISGLDETFNKYRQAATVLWEDDNLSPEILIDKTIEYLRKK